MNQRTRELLHRYAAASGATKQRIRDELVVDSEKLIRSLVHKAARAEKSTEAAEDLMQEGRIGFCRALESFDPSRKLSIATYAYHWVRHYVQTASRNARPIRLPRVRLDQADRDRVIRAVRANPLVTAEDLGVDPLGFEQTKASFGLYFDSTESERGSRELLRQSSSDALRAWQSEHDADESDRFRRRAIIGAIAVHCGAREADVTAIVVGEKVPRRRSSVVQVPTMPPATLAAPLPLPSRQAAGWAQLPIASWAMPCPSSSELLRRYQRERERHLTRLRQCEARIAKLSRETFNH